MIEDVFPDTELDKLKKKSHPQTLSEMISDSSGFDQNNKPQKNMFHDTEMKKTGDDKPREDSELISDSTSQNGNSQDTQLVEPKKNMLNDIKMTKTDSTGQNGKPQDALSALISTAGLVIRNNNLIRHNKLLVMDLNGILADVVYMKKWETGPNGIGLYMNRFFAVENLVRLPNSCQYVFKRPY